MVAIGRSGVTAEETAQVLALLAEGWKDAPAPTGFSFQLWTMMLKDLGYPLVLAAVKEAILVGTPWCPKLSEIRRRATKIAARHELVPSTAKAWEMVRKTIWRYWDDGIEGLRSLPDPVRRVASAIGWSALCDEEGAVLRAHFLRMYEAERVQAEERLAIPEWFNEECESLTAGDDELGECAT